MEQLSYERPRERLNARGASSLSSIDLLQVIIGSGSSKVSVARLARQVEAMFRQGVPSYSELIGIPGLGDAKVCQVLAAYEFGRRTHKMRYPTNIFDTDSAPLDGSFKELTRLTKRYIGYVTFNGSDEKIKSRRHMITADMSAGLIVRSIFAQALRDGAAAITMAIGYRQQVLEPSVFELDVVKAVHEAASLMQIRVMQFLLVSGSGYKEIKR